MTQLENCECEHDEVFDLIRKIVDSEIFVVVGTKKYINSLSDDNSNVSFHLKIIKEYNKPVIMINDINLLNDEKIELERYFIGFNILGIKYVDCSDKNLIIDDIVNVFKKL